MEPLAKNGGTRDGGGRSGWNSLRRSWGTLCRNHVSWAPFPRAPGPTGPREDVLDLTCVWSVQSRDCGLAPASSQLGPRRLLSSRSLSCSAPERAGLGGEEGMARPSPKAGRGGVGRDRSGRVSDPWRSSEGIGARKVGLHVLAGLCYFCHVVGKQGKSASTGLLALGEGGGLRGCRGQVGAPQILYKPSGLGSRHPSKARSLR